MSNKVFVGGIAWGTREDDLHQAFSQFGQVVEAKIITDRETGKSRGFGFVTYADGDSALNAIDKGDGMNLDGRNLRVNHATQKDPGKSQRRDGGQRRRR